MLKQLRSNEDHQNIIDQVGANVLGTAAHVVLLKAANPFTDGGFDFTLCFHVIPRR